MPTSQNGWPALEADSPFLVTWTIPTKKGDVRIRLRTGSAGFLICHYLLWYADVIEPLIGKVLDDWGWAWRAIRGQTTGLSNHASGTAADANATKHPLGTRTLTKAQKAKMWLRLKIYRGCLRSGAFYSGRVDEMHVEIDKPLRRCERVARRLMRTPRGKRILKANPGQQKVILS